jgi:hypothetical protein
MGEYAGRRSYDSDSRRDLLAGRRNESGKGCWNVSDGKYADPHRSYVLSEIYWKSESWDQPVV